MQSSNMLNEVFVLNNGISMPTVGLGTSQATLDDVRNSVEHAIDIGYRYIDCARIYGNETAIGEAISNKIKDGTVARKDLFITTKLWCTFQSPEHVQEGLDISLKNLQLDYIDLYLVHWPFGLKYNGPDNLRSTKEDGTPDYDESVDYVDTWKAFGDLYKSGKARAIGLSNFNLDQLKRVLAETDTVPAVHQIECHPYLDQEEMLNFCKMKGILVTGYSPFGSPARSWIKSTDPNIFTEPALLELAEKHNKTVAQIVLRYLIQLGTVVIPKSINPDRIESNFKVFDFNLSMDDCQIIKGLNRNRRVMPSKHHNLHKHKYFPFPENQLLSSQL